MTIKELTKERDDLKKELEALKYEFEASKKDDNNEILKALEEENKSLKELIENYKNDLIETKDIVQKLFLEKGTKTEPEKQEKENGIDKSNEELEIEDANKALNEYLKNKTEGE